METAKGSTAERRQVTIMFADISGFTAMSEKMEPEEVTRIMNECFSMMGDIIKKYGGTIDKFIGDCIMVFWGAPVSSGQDALVAVEAARDLQQAFVVLQQQHGSPYTELGLGVGIDYGEVIVGNVGTEHAMDYTVIGDTVNTAQRLEGMARSGQVLVTQRVVEAANTLPFSPVGTHRLKGKRLELAIFALDYLIQRPTEESGPSSAQG